MSDGKGVRPIVLCAHNQFPMIIAYLAALAEYIEHKFYFQCLILSLTDCMIVSFGNSSN